ncbi:MAG: dihydrodipicolinate synthase family protein [Clostridia bacterium]|nr:dihydrodipicolinate synthase family protein [Clostridia bacterium]
MHDEAKALLCSGAFLPAMPLALKEDRTFDEAAQRRLIRYYLEAGADGVAAGVHTTQFEIRRPEIGLLEPVLRTAADELRSCSARTGRRVLAVAGVCGPTEQAVKEAALAKELGYDAVLLSPGGLSDRGEDYLLERTRVVAEIIDVIGFYLQTAVGGRVFSYEYWEQLCSIPGVAAVKCAAFDRYLTLDVARAIAAAGGRVALYTGNDDSIITDLLTEYRFLIDGQEKTVRTVGGLLGHWCVWTHTAAALFRKIRALEPGVPLDPEWLTIAAQVTDANSAFFDSRNRFAGCIAGVHEVLRRQGLFAGIWCLNPEETLSPGQSAEIDRVYAMYPHLNDDAFVRAFLAQDA